MHDRLAGLLLHAAWAARDTVDYAVEIVRWLMHDIREALRRG